MFQHFSTFFIIFHHCSRPCSAEPQQLSTCSTRFIARFIFCVRHFCFAGFNAAADAGRSAAPDLSSAKHASPSLFRAAPPPERERGVPSATLVRAARPRRTCPCPHARRALFKTVRHRQSSFNCPSDFLDARRNAQRGLALHSPSPSREFSRPRNRAICAAGPFRRASGRATSLSQMNAWRGARNISDIVMPVLLASEPSQPMPAQESIESDVRARATSTEWRGGALRVERAPLSARFAPPEAILAIRTNAASEMTRWIARSVNGRRSHAYDGLGCLPTAASFPRRSSRDLAKRRARDARRASGRTSPRHRRASDVGGRRAPSDNTRGFPIFEGPLPLLQRPSHA